ncbi:putative phage major capsid protein [Actinacidiphila reveromycinica]|uniref:Putative phage major capsid protein n=1 Tax=Actinacidiphila reveromycinica TaxID=659352 RepID=A0A7U3UUT0_9ACTN|nr:phage major capsid protein [Streptomyces sp. SN-593]BBA99272.1 putative phage major capsid protein [Streptomyces sp. SN-593]
MTGEQIHQRVFALDDIQIRAGGDGRTVTAYAAVFDSPTHIRDQDGEYDEQIARTAFDKTVRERAGRIGVFYNHAKTLHGTPSESGSIPIGTPIEAPRADSRGLLTVTRYNKTPLADAVLESIRNGDITGQSFTGRFIKSDPKGPYLPDRSTGQRALVTRQEIALIEYGPTPIPAYSDAAIVGVRSQGVSGNLDTPNVADLDAAAVAHATAQGWTMPDGACPIRDLDHHGRADLDTALAAVDNTTADDVRAHITQRAAELGLSSLIPASWPSTSGRTEPAPRTPAAVHGTGAAKPAAAPTTTPEPPRHSAPTSQTRTTGMADDERMTIEERTARLGEISSRLQEIDTEFSGATLPQDVQTEWDDLNGEHDRHEEAIAAATERTERLRQLAAVPGSTERTGGGGGGTRSGDRSRVPGQIRRPENIYDLNEVRQQARSLDEMAGLYRDRAMRAIDTSQFPGADSKEAAQERAERLLNDVDDEQGTLARRMLATGSPQYNRAFGRMLMALSTNGLTTEENRALSLGVDGSGGFAVPFQLDPTVILTSDGSINPLREVSRQVQIVGKKWEGVTSAGVTVTRGAEGDEAPDSSPTLAQPSVDTQRVQGFVPFTVELEASWNAMRAEISMLLQDAKDNEEANSFFLGDGTGDNPGGLIGTMPSGSRVGQTGAAGALTVPDDLFAVEQALGPRFRRNASWMANKAIYNKIRGAAQSKGGLAGDLWARLAGGMPPELISYSAYEATAMDGAIASSGGAANYVAVLGDFQRGFLIVDRIGMSIELVPHLFGANGRPTGQRGIFAYWSNNCKILVPNAFRVLNVVSPA